MNIFIFLSSLLSLAFAQNNSDLLYYRGRSLGNTPQQQITKATEILQVIKKRTDDLGVSTAIQSFKDKKGNTYPALVIEAQGTHELNQEAKRVSNLMGKLPLVFSPYDLGRSGADAFFDPEGSMLGVSYDFVLGNVKSSSYLHELYHANTYLNLMQNKGSIWAGMMKVLSGTYLSNLNTSYYFRFASLDELPSTAYSLKLDTEQILKLKATLSPAQFNASRGEVEYLLGEIYLSVRAGYYLARQVRDLAQRAQDQVAQEEQMSLKLGTLTKKISVSSYLLESFSREIIGGRGTYVGIPDGSELKLYWNNDMLPTSKAPRLQEIVMRATRAEEAFKVAEKCIDVLIEFPQVSKTDFNCLKSRAHLPFSQL